MLTLWLADKVLDAVDGEQELSSQAIEVAQEQIKIPHSSMSYAGFALGRFVTFSILSHSFKMLPQIIHVTFWSVCPPFPYQ